jgi:2-keto-4-pentenoate hydratase/2-oxohepta-3-ene-1,7-dioic acid hydratase in catechol pathway
VQLFQTTLGAARRDGDELVVLDGTADVLAWAMSDDISGAPGKERVALSDAVLLAPTVPAQIVIVGLNYRSHVEEIGQPVPEAMMFFVSDRVEAAAGPEAPIVLPAEAPDQVDYEGEVAIVIGREARDIDPALAWTFIAGVTAANDVSARDVQMAGLANQDYTTAKTFPSFKPLGPGLITGDEARGTLSITTTVNGEVRQEADTDELIFAIPEIVATVSQSVALHPGDVILTGSPAGVGLVQAQFLSPGDVVEVTVGALPPLRNEVAAAPACEKRPRPSARPRPWHLNANTTGAVHR